jgi:hypothetical protein
MKLLVNLMDLIRAQGLDALLMLAVGTGFEGPCDGVGATTSDLEIGLERRCCLSGSASRHF